MGRLFPRASVTNLHPVLLFTEKAAIEPLRTCLRPAAQARRSRIQGGGGYTRSAAKATLDSGRHASWGPGFEHQNFSSACGVGTRQRPKKKNARSTQKVCRLAASGDSLLDFCYRNNCSICKMKQKCFLFFFAAAYNRFRFSV